MCVVVQNRRHGMEEIHRSPYEANTKYSKMDIQLLYLARHQHFQELTVSSFSSLLVMLSFFNLSFSLVCAHFLIAFFFLEALQISEELVRVGKNFAPNT